MHKNDGRTEANGGAGKAMNGNRHKGAARTCYYQLGFDTGLHLRKHQVYSVPGSGTSNNWVYMMSRASGEGSSLNCFH